ncbi:GDP-mannose 4,6-dehydratase [candidate division KSB1 bacterium]|nr:GDP-mannose 4,6-dehydratase [candidate division KSB1 bacterium]
MKILLTGGAGFIGSHLTEQLLARGDRVDCIDNFNDYYDPRIKWRNIQTALSHPGYKLIQGDILDYPLLAGLFEQRQYELMVHLAARAGVRPSLKEPMLYEEVNLKGSMHLFELAKLHEVKKVVFASSSSVYGENEKVPFSETDFVDQPISPYAATKRAGEIIAYTYHHLYELSITCLRFFTVYGPRQRPDMAIHKFTDWIYRDQVITMYGDGTSERDYTYISDIVHGIIQSIDRCQGYRIYNLGESHTISLMNLIRLIEVNLQKKAQIKQLPNQPGDVPITFADVSLARRELDYHPQVQIETGIRLFVEWFLKNRS